MPRPHVQVLLYDGFDPLDAIAPYEVMTAGSEELGGGLDLRYVSAEGSRTVRSGTAGISLAATGVLEPELPGYVLVPGVSGPVDGDPDAVDTIPVLLSRLAATEAPALLERCLGNPAITVASVCGGSLALAMAGLLDGRTATTHVLGLDLLEAIGVTVVRARVVDDGDLVSAGGVTSGLDLALYLLERDFGSHTAHAVEQLFEYERRGVVWKRADAPVGARAEPAGRR